MVEFCPQNLRKTAKNIVNLPDSFHRVEENIMSCQREQSVTI